MGTAYQCKGKQLYFKNFEKLHLNILVIIIMIYDVKLNIKYAISLLIWRVGLTKHYTVLANNIRTKGSTTNAVSGRRPKESI